MLKNPGKELRRLLQADGILMAPGFYDGISRARENGSLKVIKPGEIFSFTLEICLENTGS